MQHSDLPAYLAAARPLPLTARRPWYANIAPSYAGVFLTIAYFETLGRALPLGGLAAGLAGGLLAAALAYGLYFYVFGLIGSQTGLPLYVVGSSAFGTRGGLLIPGVFMGLLQIGWYSISTYIAARLIVQALGMQPLTPLDAIPANRGFSLVFTVIALAWGVAFAIVGAVGVDAVSRIGQFIFVVPLAMLAIAALGGLKGIPPSPPSAGASLPAVLLIAQLTVGYFATAGVAGVDFGQSARGRRDVIIGGIVGIVLPVVLSASLTLIAVAGAHVLQPNLASYIFSDALPIVSPTLARVMFLLFAIMTMPSTGFCAFIMGNSLSTMIPRVPRLAWTLAGATIGTTLAVLGVAGNLEPFFGLVGASFGPVGGAIVADWLLSGRRWAGPRPGVSLPGYAAWGIGFIVGLLNNSFIAGLIGRTLLPAWHPTGVYSFVAGFAVYWLLARAGLTREPITLPGSSVGRENS